MHCNALEHFSEKSNVVKKNWQKSDKSDVVKKICDKKVTIWCSPAVGMCYLPTVADAIRRFKSELDCNLSLARICIDLTWNLWKTSQKTLQKYRWHTFRKYKNDWVFSQLIVLMVFSLDLGVAVEAASCILCLSNMEQEPVESDCWFYEI